MASSHRDASSVERTAETLSDAAAASRTPGLRAHWRFVTAPVASQPAMLFLQNSYSDISAAYRALVAKTFLSATLAKFLFNRGRT